LIQMAVGLASQNEIIRSIFFNKRIDMDNLDSQIDFIKKRYNLDFLLLINPDGNIKAGYTTFSLNEKKIWQDEIILQALRGNVSVGTNLIQYEDLESIDRELANKAFITLVQTELARPTEKTIENNPIVDMVKYLVFREKKVFEVERSAKFGGNVSFDKYADFEREYLGGKIHPQDLKMSVAREINEIIKPIREHFEKPNKKKLLNVFEETEVTR